MNNIDLIRNLQLHDVTVSCVSFKWGEFSIRIEYLSYDEKIKDSVSKSIEFRNVSALEFNCSSIFNIVEITNVTISKTDEGYNSDIVFLSSFGGPSYEMSFDFKSVVIG